MHWIYFYWTFSEYYLYIFWFCDAFHMTAWTILPVQNIEYSFASTIMFQKKVAAFQRFRTAANDVGDIFHTVKQQATFLILWTVRYFYFLTCCQIIFAFICCTWMQGRLSIKFEGLGAFNLLFKLIHFNNSKENISRVEIDEGQRSRRSDWAYWLVWS